MKDPVAYDQRLDNVVNLLIRFGQGEFDAREKPSGNDDHMDTVITGLNMLGEELQHYKEQLSAKSAFLENIINNVSEMIYVLVLDKSSTPSFSVEFISPQVQQMLGYTPEELTENRGAVKVHDEDLPILREALRQVLAGQAASCQYRVLHKDGRQYVWLEDKLSPKKDVHGNVLRIFGSARDVTKRKLAEEQAREAEEKLAEQRQFTDSILSNLPTDIAVFDQDHRYIFLNRRAVKDPEIRNWLIGKDDFDYCRRKGLPTSSAEMRREKFNRTLRSGEETEWVDEHISPQGEKRYVLRRFYPHYENGQLKYVIGYGIDFTQQKKAEEELAEQRQFIESVLNNIPAEIAVVDKEQRYLFINRYAARDPQMRQWLIGKSDFDFCREHNRSATFAMERQERFQQALQSRDGVQWVDSDVNGQKEDIWVLRRLYPHYENGELKYMIGCGIDFTQQKKAEEERERLLKELGHKYNELMQFNYIVSHNLRAPVTRIMGMANLLKMSPDPAERERINDYMVRSAETIDAMIKDLNVILATRSPLNERKEIFTLSEIVSAVSDNLELQIKESGAIICTDIEERADTLVSIKSYIQSAVFNLISNAIKYKSGERPPRISIRAQKINGETLIEVQDNGMGIDLKAHGEYIFGLYKRFNTEIEGKGLGLHMTKTQIESLGGSISVKSEPGAGTTFTIVLPEGKPVLRVA